MAAPDNALYVLQQGTSALPNSFILSATGGLAISTTTLPSRVITFRTQGLLNSLSTLSSSSFGFIYKDANASTGSLRAIQSSSTITANLSSSSFQLSMVPSSSLQLVNVRTVGGDFATGSTIRFQTNGPISINAIDDVDDPTIINMFVRSTAASQDATFIVQSASGTVPNAQSLGSLSSGLLKNTVASSRGTLSRAIPGTDYYDPATTTAFVLYNTINANTVTLRAGVTANTYSLAFPTNQGSNGQALLTDGVGNLYWGNGGGGGGGNINGPSSGTSAGQITTWSSSAATIQASPAAVVTAGQLTLGLSSGTSGATVGSLVLRNATNPNTFTMRQPTTGSSNITWVLPDSNGTSGYVLSTDGSGNLSWVAAGGSGGGNVSGPGSGTIVNQVVTWGNTAGTLIAKNASAFISNASLTLGTSSAGSKAQVILYHDTSTFPVTIQPGNTSSPGYTWTLPAAQGGANQFLQNDGNGNLSWATAGGGGGGNVSSSGTPVSGQLAIWTGSSVIQGLSSFTASGTLLTLGSSTTTTNSGVVFNSTGSNSNTITLRAGATGAAYTLTLPTAAPAVNQVLVSDASGNLSWGAFTTGTVTVSGSAPTAGRLATFANASAIQDNTVITASGTSLTLGSSVTTTNSSIIFNSTGSNSNTITLQAGATGSAYTWTLPAAQGGANQFLQNDGNGNLSWATAGGGGGGNVSSSGTPVSAQLAIWTGASVIQGLSSFTASGTSLTLGTSATTTNSAIVFNSTGSNTNTITLQAGATGAAYTLTLPTAQGGANQFLQNDGNGNLSWATAGGGGGGNVSSSGTPVSGQLAIWTGASVIQGLSSFTASGTSLTLGSSATTTNSAIVFNSTGSNTNTITLQAGATGATYTLTLPAAAPVANQALVSDASGNLSWGAFTTGTVTVSGSAPTAGRLATFANASAIQDNTVITASGTSLTLGSSATTTNSAIVFNSTGSNSNTITLQAGATGSAYTLTLPAAQGGANQFLQNDGNGNLSWATAGGGGGGNVSSSGTPVSGQLAIWTGASVIQGLSSFTASGTSLTLGTSATTTNSAIVFNSTGSNSNTITLRAGATGAAYTLTLPTAAPVANQALVSDSSGNLSWVTPSGGTVTVAGSAPTSGRIVTWNDATSIQDAATISAATTVLTLGSPTTRTNAAVVFNSVGADLNTVTLRADATLAAYTLTLPTGQGSANQFLQNDGSGNLRWSSAGTGTVTTTAGTTAAGQLTVFADTTGTVINSVVMSASATTLTLGTSATTTNSAIVFNSTGSNSNTITLRAGATGAAYTLTLPTAAPAVNQVLVSDASGNLSWGAFTTGTVTVSGSAPTAGRLATFANASAIQDNTVITAGATSLILGSSATTTNSAIVFNSTGSNSNTITLQAGATAIGYGLTLPTAAPAANQSLVSDASGNLSWAIIGQTYIADNISYSGFPAYNSTAYIQYTPSNALLALLRNTSSTGYLYIQNPGLTLQVSTSVTYYFRVTITTDYAAEPGDVSAVELSYTTGNSIVGVPALRIPISSIAHVNANYLRIRISVPTSLSVSLLSYSRQIIVTYGNAPY